MEPVLTEARFAAFVGIDWADVKHDLCLQAVGSNAFEFATLEHTPEAIAAWASSLHQRFRGKPVAICLELDQGPLVYPLREYDFFVVFPVNPPSPIIQALAQLVEHRRRLVGDKVRLISRLISVLKNYYPQVLRWFTDRDTLLFCEFLTR